MSGLVVVTTAKDIERIKNACKNHTLNQPTGYVAWHDWAKKMSRTHRQIKCECCGLYQIWVPKRKRA